MKLTLKLILSISLLHFGSCKESVFRDLFRKGILGRSYEPREEYDDPTRDSILYPEHREELGDVELEEHSAPKNAYSLHQSHHQHHPQNIKEYTDNRKGAYKIMYHTDIIENDNMDLYGIIGGISFASLLATTLFILSRREGSVLRSLDEMFGSDMPTYRKTDRILPRDWLKEHNFLGNRRNIN